MTSTGVKFTQPYCAGFNIPQIAPVATDPTFSFTPANFPCLVRLSPSDKIQCQALAGLISHYNWTQIALLTSKDDYGLCLCFSFIFSYHCLLHVISSHIMESCIERLKHQQNKHGGGVRLLDMSSGGPGFRSFVTTRWGFVTL